MSDEAVRKRNEVLTRMSVFADTTISPDQAKEASVDFDKADSALSVCWTSEKPTRSGWYWYRSDNRSVAIIMMVHPFRPENFWLTFPGEWAGP